MNENKQNHAAPHDVLGLVGKGALAGLSPSSFMAAQVFDLAERGYVQVQAKTYKDKKHFPYTFKVQKDPELLAPPERMLLDALQQLPDYTEGIFTLANGNDFSEKLTSYLTQNQYLEANQRRQHIITSLKAAVVYMALMFMIIVLAMQINKNSPVIGPLIVLAVVAALTAVVIGLLLPANPLTPKGEWVRYEILQRKAVIDGGLTPTSLLSQAEATFFEVDGFHAPRKVPAWFVTHEEDALAAYNRFVKDIKQLFHVHATGNEAPLTTE